MLNKIITLGILPIICSLAYLGYKNLITIGNRFYSQSKVDRNETIVREVFHLYQRESYSYHEWAGIWRLQQRCQGR